MLHIRAYTPSDWPAVEQISREGIATGLATFDSEPKSQTAWETKSLPGSQIVAEADGKVLGWAVLWPVSDRCCYAGVAEVSVYVGADARGRGVGYALLARLNDLSEDLGIWTQQAAIMEENTPSIRMHEKAGYRLVGLRERLGKLGSRWLNVALMERRSDKVGT